jgi:polyhydroxybutyrate depolymerase
MAAKAATPRTESRAAPGSLQSLQRVLACVALAGATASTGACGASDDSNPFASSANSAGTGGETAVAAGAGGSPDDAGSAGTAGTASDGGVNGGGTNSGGTGGAAGGNAQPACAPLPGTPGSHTTTLTSSGRERTAQVHVPASYSGDATMLVLAFHGWLQNPGLLEGRSNLSASSDNHGFIVVYPQGLSDSWNAGACCGSPPGEGNDDVQFARDLVAHLQTQYCIDPDRIYSTGFSNGAMMSHRLGCEAADLFAAIAPVSGQIGVSSCAPSRPIPVWEIQGTADLILPFNGLGSLADTIAGWVQRNGCTDGQPAEIYKNGSTACHGYTACQEGADIHVCEIQGGGHNWPDGGSGIDATETLYRFFVAHPMPGG